MSPDSGESSPTDGPDKPASSQPSSGKGCLVGCGVVLVLISLVIAIAVSAGSNSSRDTEDDRTMAWVMCKSRVDELLKAPSTAGYPMMTEFDIARSGNTYTLDAWVDAQNSFGANIRTYFSCTATNKGAGSWNVQVTSQ